MGVKRGNDSGVGDLQKRCVGWNGEKVPRVLEIFLKYVEAEILPLAEP